MVHLYCQNFHHFYPIPSSPQKDLTKKQKYPNKKYNKKSESLINKILVALNEKLAQKFINKNLTMKSKNLEVTGFKKEKIEL